MPVALTELKKEEGEVLNSYRAMEEEQQSAYLALARVTKKNT